MGTKQTRAEELLKTPVKDELAGTVSTRLRDSISDEMKFMDFRETEQYAEWHRLKMIFRNTVRTYVDITELHTQCGGRLAIKANGERQLDANDRPLQPEDMVMVKMVHEHTAEWKKRLSAELEDLLQQFPIWTEFLEGVEGIGPVLAARLICDLNPFLSDKPSSFVHYAGMNPTYVFGRKNMSKAEATAAIKKNPNWKIVGTKSTPSGGHRYIVETDICVKADRPTEGFILPYNKELRKTVCGVIMGSMLKTAKGHKYEQIYRNARTRLLQDPAWQYRGDSHQHRHATRIAMTQLVIDLHINWRTLYGLHVRPPYAEEKFGHKHGHVNNDVAVYLDADLNDLVDKAARGEEVFGALLDQKSKATDADIRAARIIMEDIKTSNGWTTKDEVSGKSITKANTRIAQLRDKVTKALKEMPKTSLKKQTVRSLFGTCNDVRVAVQNLGRVRATEQFRASEEDDTAAAVA
jgi:hypothetical protein